MTKTNESITYQVLSMDLDCPNHATMKEISEYTSAVDRLNYIRSINPDKRFRLIKITRITLEEFTQD